MGVGGLLIIKKKTCLINLDRQPFIWWSLCICVNCTFSIIHNIQVIDKCLGDTSCSCKSADTKTANKSVKAKAEMRLDLELCFLWLIEALRDSLVLASYLLLVGQEKILGQ